MKKWAVFLASLIYYSVLSAKNFTWIFVSGDSGDWLASAKMWFVPQGFGSPLYITLAKIPGLFATNLPASMAIFLSALPAAVTVTLVYLILKGLANDKAALIGAGVLLGSAVFLTQSTIVEEYALSAMFITLAFYFYINQRKQLTGLSLGLATAVHVMALPLAVLWFGLHLKEWRKWVRVIPIYAISGLAPYILILVLMASDAPRLFAGGFSWPAVNEYLGGTYVVGSLSLWATPERLFALVGLMLASFGLGWIAFFKGFDKSLTSKVIIISIVFPAWYYITCLHPSTWTYLTWASPFIAIAIGIGLTKLPIKSYTPVLISACILIVVNAMCLNAAALSKNSEAEATLDALMALPDGSAVVTNRYGWNAFTLYYAVALGKDITPIFLTVEPESVLYQNYLEWVEFEGNTPQELAHDALNKGVKVYYMIPTSYAEEWQEVFAYDKTGSIIFEITGVDLNKVVIAE